MRWPTLAITIPALVLAAPLGGCSSQPPAVSGEVTLDGQPLADGAITYVPVDQQTPNVEVKIQDGKYSARVPVGRYKVRINAAKAPGERRIKYDAPGPPPVAAYAERIPERYNAKTELQTDIEPGDNKRDWPVTSK